MSCIALRNRCRFLPRQWPRATVVALGLALALCCEQRVAGWPGKGGLAESSTSKTGSATTLPWGELETREFALELSDELLPEANMLLKQTKWTFNGYSLAQVTNLLRSCQFSPADLERSFERADFTLAIPPGLSLERYGMSIRLDDMEPLSVSLYPPSDLVLNLQPDARKRIYTILAASGQNPSQRSPFQIPAAHFEASLLEAGLPVEKLVKIKQLAYLNDRRMCLADLEPLKNVLADAEMKKLLKAVYRNPTFVMRLQLSSRSDMDTLARYWGRGGRIRLIKPFLEGLSKMPGKSSVNVAFLMPAFARTHLYTFPDPSKEPAYPRNGGLWTALNFFNEQPDDRFLDREHANQVLQTRFEKGNQTPEYGDLIALFSPGGELVHIAVYIAQDVIFTRSGMGDLQPWVLMRLPEMVKRFQTPQGDLQTIVYRRKEA